MPESEEDDFDALPEGELLTLPDGAIEINQQAVEIP